MNVSYNNNNQDSVLGSVIQASGMVLFEDALKAGTLVEDIWSDASIRPIPVVSLVPLFAEPSRPGCVAWGRSGLRGLSRLVPAYRVRHWNVKQGEIASISLHSEADTTKLHVGKFSRLLRIGSCPKILAQLQYGLSRGYKANPVRNVLSPP